MCRYLSACSQERNILVIQQFIFNNEKMSLYFHNGGTSFHSLQQRMCVFPHILASISCLFSFLTVIPWSSRAGSAVSRAVALQENQNEVVANCNSSSCAPAALSGFGRLLRAPACAWYTDTHAGSTAVHIKIKIAFLKAKSLLIYWRRSMPQQVRERQKTTLTTHSRDQAFRLGRKLLYPPSQLPSLVSLFLTIAICLERDEISK